MNNSKLSKPLSTGLNSQIEEVTHAMSLMDKMKIAGGEKVSSSALYLLDRDIEKNMM